MGSEEDEDPNYFQCQICFMERCVSVTTPCNHVVCFPCLNTIYKTNPSCPMCRTDLPDDFSNYSFHAHFFPEDVDVEDLQEEFIGLCFCSSPWQQIISFVEAGVDVNMVDHDGISPLEYFYKSDIEWGCIWYLLKNGINFGLRSNKDWIVDILNAAACDGRMDVVLTILKEAPSAIRKVDSLGRNALFTAAAWDCTKITRFLIAQNADVNMIQREKNRHSPLTIASHFGCIGSIKLLIEGKANIEYVSANGFTALLHATENGHIEAVKLLIAAKANVNHIAGSNGYTALYLSVQNLHHGITKLLLQSDVDTEDTIDCFYSHKKESKTFLQSMFEAMKLDG